MGVEFDLVVRGGTIVDGSGGARYVGDIGVADGRITAIGEIAGSGTKEIDAHDRIVTPGFVDIHTHYDGHATWTNHLEPSSQHGVTTVVTGNCGVGFAPCRPEDRENLVRLMEGVEDIPEAVMSAGLPWTWESFSDYLDVLGNRQFDMDIATQIPHAPLRVYVMGARALNREPATDDDIAKMRDLVREAIAAGAVGFSTSRSLNHKASDGSVTPSYAAAKDELAGIAEALDEAGTGVLQFISDFDDIDAEFRIVRHMVERSGRPLSMSLLQVPHHPDRWRSLYERVEEARAEGMEIRTQVCGRPIGVILGIDFSSNPFMRCKSYIEVAGLERTTRIAALRDPQTRDRILAEFSSMDEDNPFRLMTNFSSMYEMAEIPDYEPRPEDCVEAKARREGVAPAELAYRIIAEEGGVIYFPAANFAGNSIEPLRTMLAHPASVLGLGDGGAHCGLICDASMPTYMLSRWVRSDSGARTDEDRLSLERVVQMLTAETAQAVRLQDRGRIAIGLRADINVIDMDRIGLMRPEAYADLPNGAIRLGQRSTGYDATIVAGVPTYLGGERTGILPGRLVRGGKRVH